MSRRIARDVVVDHVNSTITIDGHLFPYCVRDNVAVASDRLPYVRMELLADNIRVVTADGEFNYPNPWPDRAEPTEGAPCC